jgi:hypothetical protein
MGAMMLATALGRRSHYRMYNITTKLVSGGAVSTVYNGEEPIYKAYAYNEVDALLRAQQWIDEQEAYAVEYDLTSAQPVNRTAA